MKPPTLKEQEIPFDHSESCNFFRPSPRKPFVPTPAALGLYRDDIPSCLEYLQALACVHRGLDRLQVFEDPSKSEPLWFIEDGDGGAITAILPSDY
ncbi:MAG TPA: hypothetical protein VD866_28490 [Urbifossiella sp.]|nr:hypothetical protein [Urbifossiella sp.]